MVCAILSLGWGIEKIPCCYSERVAHVVAAVGFLSHCLGGPLLYIQRHISINKMLSTLLNKTFPSFFIIITWDIIQFNFKLEILFVFVLLTKIVIMFLTF